MNFPTILNQQYDPNDTAKNVTTQAKLRKFTNEPNKLDDLFESASDYEKVEKEAAAEFSHEELVQFNQYRTIRISHLFTDLLQLN